MDILKFIKTSRMVIDSIILWQDGYEEENIKNAVDSLYYDTEWDESIPNVKRIKEYLYKQILNKEYMFDLIYEYDDKSIPKKLNYYLLKLLKYGRSKGLITFNDYLDIKIEELDFYAGHRLQSLWFTVQEEVSEREHPFQDEIKNYDLEKIFLNGSDYCDQDLAMGIIHELVKIKKSI